MRLNWILLFSYLLSLATGTTDAGNFIVDQKMSELAADMHASPSHDFTSVAKKYECDIEIDPDSLQITRASCRFNFEDLDSEKKSRDKKMCKWMNTEHYPEASYTMKKLTQTGVPGRYQAEGVFLMHGKSLPLNIQLHLSHSGEQITLTGTTQLDYQDWGLEKVKLLFFSVDPTLKPHFRLVGHLKAPSDDA